MTQAKLNTQQCNDLNKAISSSCRILTIREHSEKQLRLKLEKRAFEKTTISACIRFLKEENWLSEERFCNAFIRSRVEKGQGLQRILYELEQQDISRDIIQKQLDVEAIDWQSVCERVLRKKILTNSSAAQEFSHNEHGQIKMSYGSKSKEKIKIEKFLSYRGFSFDEIKRAFGQIARKELRSSNK